MRKTGEDGEVRRFLESSGGPILALVGLVTFFLYLGFVFRHLYLGHMFVSTLISVLQEHSSAAQAVSIAAVLIAALIEWGWRKMLFKIREREQLIEQNLEQTALIAELRAENAELRANNAQKDAKVEDITNRVARLETLSEKK